MKKTTTLFAFGLGVFLLSFAVRQVRIVAESINMHMPNYLIANVEALTQADLDISFFWKAQSIEIKIWTEEYPIAGTRETKKITYKQTTCHGTNGQLECFPGTEIIG